MKYLLYWLSRYLEIQARLCQWLLLLLGIAMTVLILLQVFCRFVVYVPLPWSEECARYLMVWMGMLGSVLAFEKGRHIGVTVFMDALPPVLRCWGSRVVQLVIIGFLGIMCYQGVVLSSLNADQRSPALEVSMLVPYLALPVGFAMMILVLVGDLCQEKRTDSDAIRGGIL